MECLGTTPPQRVSSIHIDDDLVAYVSLVEDMIIDRLCAEVFWNSKIDGEWARTLLAGDGIDWSYLEERAAMEDVLERLAEVRRDMGLKT